ncbi:MAG: hypothetical protein ACD_39C00864G0002 [uncultured bacterium]|nr:MAG: hypothetical protein ACD_39C00864G0002 [uncultured bacterium]
MRHYTKTGRQKGFTLLELIIVIGIIAALVGIAVPYYGDYVNESKYAVMRSNLHTFEKALMDYRADKGFYPATANVYDLVSGSPQYLVEFPIDPTDGAPATWGYSLPYNLPADVPVGEKYRYVLDSRYDAYRKP